MGSLDGRSALITGGASGIGRAGAKVFAEAGGRLTLVDRDKDGLEAVESELSAGGHAVQTFVGDVTNPQDCERMVQMAVDTHGGLDVIWNNAGIVGPGNLIADLALEDWQQVLSINLTG